MSPIISIILLLQIIVNDRMIRVLRILPLLIYTCRMSRMTSMCASGTSFKQGVDVLFVGSTVA